MKKRDLSLNYKLSLTGVFAALSILLSFTPLGYIHIGGIIEITLMHIPVILTVLLAGLFPGLSVGAIFGISSLVHALMMGSPSGIFFRNPLVSVVPRILFPFIVWLIFSLFNAIPRFPKIVSSSLAAAVGTFSHTVLVMLSLFIFYGDFFVPLVAGAIEKLGLKSDSISGFQAFVSCIVITMISNGLLELIVAVVITASVIKITSANSHHKAKISKFE